MDTLIKDSTSVALTGGAGFVFEDGVAAWFLAHLISNRPPLETDFGVVISVDFQVGESGWILDDLLITGRPGEAAPKRLSVSIKRDRQVTSNGFPPNFVEAVWNQWLATQGNPFLKDQDLFCLAVGQLADTVKSAWDEMLSQALNTDPMRMARRFSSQASSIQRALFESLHCPPHLRTEGDTDEIATAQLLKHIRLLHFDFRSPSSNAKAMAIQCCQKSLNSQRIDEAIDLWSELVAISADLRPLGGSVDLHQLLRKLKKYRFTDFPDFHSDWAILRGTSEDAMSGIRTEIGEGVSISREALVNEIIEGLDSLRVQVLLGESGSGKSALIKTIAGTGVFDRVIWFNSYHLNGPGLHFISKSLDLKHDLTKLLQSAGTQKSLLVFDAVDKFSHDSLRIAQQLIESLKLQEEGSRWHVILTSQPLNWPILQRVILAGFKLAKEIVRVVELLDWVELQSIRQVLPYLSPLLLRPDLKKFLGNLKILDWVATAAEKGTPDPTKWISESDLIDWIWDSWVLTGAERYVRDSLLQKIGAKEAESFSSGVSLSELTLLEQHMLSSLEDSQLLRVTKEIVNFEHDMMGDWARLHVLIGLREMEVAQGLKSRAANPYWHQAIRLFGLRTLERETDSSKWYQLHQQLNDESDIGTVAADLLLEAAGFSTNAWLLLERLWPHLSGNSGVLLQRLIKRFRHSASYPEPQISIKAPDDELSLWLSSSMRIPYWPYWVPMLTFLRSHADEVKTLAMGSASELCQLWLSQIPIQIKSGEPFPGRRQAAELALLIAREVQGQKAEHVLFSRGTDESPYEAFLYGAPDCPEQVSTLALELAQRRPPAAEIQQRATDSARRRSEEQERRFREDPELRERLEDLKRSAPISFFRGRINDPWPDGPQSRIDDAFRKACMNKNALQFLMQFQPEVAKELILSLCIETPRYEYDSDGLELMKHGIASCYEEAIFFQGPFLLFLRTSPNVAIELILNLVKFATERWREWAKKPNGIEFGDDINEDQTVDLWNENEQHKWLGDCRVFGWYRNRLIGANYLVSALMALEKWLYDEAEAGRDVCKWVEKIIRESNSTAFAGVLVALSKKHPELLLSCLKPILSIWQIFQWDFNIIQDDCSGIFLFTWARKGKEVYNIVRDWHFMSHRKIVYRDFIVNRMLSDQEFQNHFAEIREKWRLQLNNTKDPIRREFVIERFNPNNYKLYEDENGNRFTMLEWPEHLKEYTQTVIESSSYSMDLMSFPIRCREILKSNNVMEPNDLERHWSKIRFFVNEFENQNVENSYFNNAVMAGIAVLVILHSDWLRNNFENEMWCKNQIQRIITAEYVRDPIDVPYSISEIGWQNFFGEIVVFCLSGYSLIDDIRHHLAQSICAFHYVTTKIVCQAAYRLRNKLGSDFGRILNLSMQWSGIRWAFGRYKRFEVENEKLEQWYESVVKSFIDCTLSDQPIPLRDIALKSEDMICHAKAIHNPEYCKGGFIPELQFRPANCHTEVGLNRNSLGLDWEVIQASYAWLTSLDQAINREERKRWIAIHRELLDLELAYLRSDPRDSRGEMNGTPYGFERWVLTCVARVIPQLHQEENPSEFWQPILDLGAQAHYWVESFLSMWFMEGTKSASSPGGFVSRWGEMIQYALTSPLWRNNFSVPNYYRLDDLWIKLMGLGIGAETIGQQEYFEGVSGLIPLYETWAKEWLNHASIVNAFANFLMKPAARKMMLVGLAWLAEGIKEIRHKNWETYSLSDNLVSLLYNCWRIDGSKIEVRPEIRSAFYNILNLLISKNYAAALELRDQIIQAPKH